MPRRASKMMKRELREKERIANMAAEDTTRPVPILVLMGTAGCGKTTIAEMMVALLHCEYLEGDVLHPPANVEKMSRGEPLNDDDRWPWLRLIRKVLADKAHVLYSQPNIPSRLIVLTCSSLRKVYRDILRDIPPQEASVTFVYLKGTPELLYQRITSRKGHFMAGNMLQSQLDTLEVPDPREESVIVADISQDPLHVAKFVIEEARQRGILV